MGGAPKPARSPRPLPGVSRVGPPPMPNSGVQRSATDGEPTNRRSPISPKPVTTFRTVPAIGSAEPASPGLRLPGHLPGVSRVGPVPNPAVYSSSTHLEPTDRLPAKTSEAVSAAVKTLRPRGTDRDARGRNAVTTFHTAAPVGDPEPASPRSRSSCTFPGVSRPVSNRFIGRTLIRLSRNSAYEPGPRLLPSVRYLAADRRPTNRLSPVSPKAVTTFRTVAAIGSAEPASTVSRSPGDFPDVSRPGPRPLRHPDLRPSPNPGARYSATDRQPTYRLSPVSLKAVSAAAKTLRPAVPTVTPAGGNQ